MRDKEDLRDLEEKLKTYWEKWGTEDNPILKYMYEVVIAEYSKDVKYLRGKLEEVTILENHS